MSTPHACPKCNATGFLSFNPAIGPVPPTWPTTSMQSSWPCDVCERGIIWSRTEPSHPPLSDAERNALSAMVPFGASYPVNPLIRQTNTAKESTDGR